MIRFSNIVKSFDSITALKGVNLEFLTSQTSVLIGPSGCGKSTLIKLIVGIYKPNSGNIYINGEKITQQNIQKFRRKIGYVIQEGGLFPHLTAKQNVTLMANFCGWDKNQIEKRLEELADLTKITKDVLTRYPIHLSGGQNQRIGLMRALMLDPDLLLLDEPLGALDPMIRYELQSDLKNIFRALNKTVLLVTHDLGEAEYFGDQIILMKDGLIIQQGIFQDFLKNPADIFVTKFIQAQRGLTVK